VFFDKTDEWDGIIKGLVITSIEDTGKMNMAREGRLTLKRYRLEAEKLVVAKRDAVKAAMADQVLEDKLWLKSWQMMEATFKNLETQLEEKEKFAERWEADMKEKLRAERLAQLEPLGYIDFGTGFRLSEIDEPTFQALKSGLEKAKADKEEAERKAEEERIAREKEQERIRLENEQLKKEREAREKEAARIKKETEDRERRIKAEQEAILKKEREAREKVEAQLKAKKEAEAREKQRQAAEAKKARLAPDKDKLIALADSIKTVVFPVVESEEAKNALIGVRSLLVKVDQYIRAKAEELK